MSKIYLLNYLGNWLKFYFMSCISSKIWENITTSTVNLIEILLLQMTIDVFFKFQKILILSKTVYFYKMKKLLLNKVWLDVKIIFLKLLNSFGQKMQFNQSICTCIFHLLFSPQRRQAVYTVFRKKYLVF